MTLTPAPGPNTDRSDILDVLRGFALLGIFIANSAGFALYLFMDAGARDALPTHATDKWFDYFLTAIVDGKFYTLFSLLFGIGFTIILDRNQKAGRNPLVIFYRRIFILTLLGLGHLLLLWPGDILFLYALVGMVLPLFRNLSNTTLLITAVCLIFSPLLFDLAKVISDGAWNLATPLVKIAIEVDASYGIDQKNFISYLADSTHYQNIYNWCQGGFFWRFDHIIGSNRIPKVLAMFLIGFVVGRKEIYSNLEANTQLLFKVQKLGFLIGLPGSFALCYFEFDGVHLPEAGGLADTFFYAISVIPLSLAYTATLCLLWLKSSWKPLLRYLAPAGRMALTNYMVQSFIGIYIYYGIGLGMGSRTGPTVFVPIAFVVFIVQVIYSNIWFRYFYYGPLEWIWRQLTYGKVLPIRVTKARL